MTGVQWVWLFLLKIHKVCSKMHIRYTLLGRDNIDANSCLVGSSTPNRLWTTGMSRYDLIIIIMHSMLSIYPTNMLPSKGWEEKLRMWTYPLHYFSSSSHICHDGPVQAWSFNRTGKVILNAMIVQYQCWLIFPPLQQVFVLMEPWLDSFFTKEPHKFPSQHLNFSSYLTNFWIPSYTPTLCIMLWVLTREYVFWIV